MRRRRRAVRRPCSSWPCSFGSGRVEWSDVSAQSAAEARGARRKGPRSRGSALGGRAGESERASCRVASRSKERFLGAVECTASMPSEAMPSIRESQLPPQGTSRTSPLAPGPVARPQCMRQDRLPHLNPRELSKSTQNTALNGAQTCPARKALCPAASRRASTTADDDLRARTARPSGSARRVRSRRRQARGPG